MATSYAQLGVVAHRQGQFDTAETLYRRALGIFERLSVLTIAAPSYKNLATLREAAGDLDHAVTYRVRAFAIQFKAGILEANDAQRLIGLRLKLGSDRFRVAALASGLDENSAVNLMNILDQLEKNIKD